MSIFARLSRTIRHGYCLNRSELNEDVVKARDDVGTLLHHAAKHGNISSIELLIELGSEIDLFVAGQTPLMLAVNSTHLKSVEVVEALLRANANAELANDVGRSVLAMALGSDIFSSPFIRAFIRNFLANDRTSDEIAEILINAGGNMFHAVKLKDMELMECMFERGIDVNSKAQWARRTGLHRAAREDDVILVEWLIEHGADVNAIDEIGDSPLFAAATSISKESLKLLLKHGADPNFKGGFDSTPLYAIFQRMSKLNQRGLECVELLLRYGAIPRNSSVILGTMFDHALDQSSDEVIWMIISQLAMFEIRGVPIDKSVILCKDVRHRSRNPEFETFYQTCLLLLETPVYGKLSLSDLLNGSESTLQSLVRNEKFVAEMRKVCSERELKKLNSYYCKRAMERIDAASRVVKLKNEAIQVVCRLFEGNYHECYVFARKVVDYLDICDLEKLVVIAKTFQT